MIFNQNGMVWIQVPGNLRMILRRNRLFVKKVSVIIELNHISPRQSVQPETDLLRDGTGRSWLISGIFPEVTHHTFKGALFIGKKERIYLSDCAVLSWFLLMKPVIRSPGINLLLGRPLVDDLFTIRHRVTENNFGRSSHSRGTVR